MNLRTTRLGLLLLPSILLFIVGCGTKQLMPTPRLYAQGQADPFPDVPPALQNNRVEVLYLTDRKRESESPDNPKYHDKRSRSITFGVSEVQFGKDISWDQLVAASRSEKRSVDLPVLVVHTTELVRFPDSPRITFPPATQPGATGPTTTVATAPATTSAEMDDAKVRMLAELSARLAQTPTKEVYLFVHGYNNTFDDSVTTIAQMWHFLGRQGVPIAYSWPAGHSGLLRGYTYDRESSEFTVFHLKEMLRLIAQCPDVKKVNIICHSRGTGVVVSAVGELNLQIAGSGRSAREVLKLGTAVLAAPDIDFDVYIQKTMSMRLGLVPEHAAIYVCAKDKALGIANLLFGGISRTGKIRSEMVPADELEYLRASPTIQLIDARISDPGDFGHSYFHSNPAVSSDIILLMRYHRDPGASNGRPLRSDGSGFWILDDDYLKQTPASHSTTAP